ncbi:MAG: peptide ABC transporter substrate-binding protein [Chloroflexota bacterium]|nr:peptide ABC transporter substrate-binding protein [Chloroflexota bacterium]
MATFDSIMTRRAPGADPTLGYRRLAMLDQRLRRRGVLGGALGLAGLAAFGAGNLAAARQEAATPMMGDDAAPPDQQIFVVSGNPTLDLTPDFYEAVYQRPGGSQDIFSDPLVRMNRDLQIIPGAALSWESNPEGTVWTFQIDPDLMWNDGTPVTANDWVATFQYGADPEHAWDFAWFFQDIIVNWNEALAGDVPPAELGVAVGANDRELVVETFNAAPYLPAMMLYSNPLSAKALAESGPLYNSNPATSVSSGPMMLDEWTLDQRIVYVKNPDYQGTLLMPVEKIVIKLADPSTWFTMYQNDEIDFMEGPAPAELQIAEAEFPDQVYSGVGDFKTYYLFFDVTQAPFDNHQVRQAFSHVVDRDAIQQAILGPSGFPAVSYLMPGFPGANADELAGIQNFDPELGRQLLAEAGFPDGAGFPPQTMWLRNENPLNQTVANAIAAGITQHLGIPVEVQNQDSATFMDALTAKPTEILFGYVSYGMDFFDPFNMLSVWLGGGRHSWANDDFDSQVREAAAFTGDPDERIALFHAAEQLLVEEVPAVWVYHVTPVQLIKPWVKGDFIAPDGNGITALHWLGYTGMSTVPAELYIAADAPVGREN